jgi:sulfane dehydrogenase subunit SoxC
MTKPTDIDKNATAASRRRFLRESGALLGGAFIAGGLAGSEARAGSANTANHAPNVPEWMKTQASLMGHLRRSRKMSSRTSRRREVATANRSAL